MQSWLAWAVRVRTPLCDLAPCLQVVEQRRKLPPVVNDKALFTRAAPFGDRSDQAYHAPSNRIGTYYSPASARAAAQLFEEFPQVRWAVQGVATYIS